MKKTGYFIGLFFMGIISAYGYGGIGAVSNNILGPVQGFAYLMNAVCYVIGFGFLLTGLLQYKNYRENPQQVKLSTPVILALLGGLFIALPFIGMLSSSSAILKS